MFIYEYMLYTCVCACMGLHFLTPPFLLPVLPVFAHSHLSQIQSPRYFS